MPPNFPAYLWLPLCVGLWVTGPRGLTLAAEVQALQFTDRQTKLPIHSLDSTFLPVTPAPARTLEDPYVLGPGDQVSIQVIGYDELNGTRVVLPDGTISMPLVGSFSVAGQTTDRVRQQLTTALQPFLVNPVVDVSLSILRPIIVNVAGDVYRPGPRQLSSLTNITERDGLNAAITTEINSIPTLSQALSAAGGVRRTADIAAVVLQRQRPGGQIETLTVNLWEALTVGSLAADVILRDGDTIFVPQATAASDIDPQLLARSTFAPNRVRVRVVGEVNAPGEIEVTPSSSLSSAVAIAGGPTRDAQLNQVALIRRDEDSGEIRQIAVDLSNLMDDVQIQDGDVVVVPQRGYLNVLDSVSRVTQTLLSPFGLFNLLQDIGIFR